MSKSNIMSLNCKIAPEYVEKHSTRYLQYEGFWVKQIQDMQTIILPFHTKAAAFYADVSIQKTVIDDPIIKKLLDSYRADASAEQIMLAALLAYFLRLNHAEAFSVVFSHPGISALGGSLFSNWVPFNCYHEAESPFSDLLAAISLQYEKIMSKGTFPEALFTQYSNVQRQDFRITVTIVEDDDFKPQEDSLIHWVISRKCNALTVYFPGSEAVAITQMLHYFYHFVRAILRAPGSPTIQLALLTDQEFKKLTHEWNQTETTFSKKGSLQQLFEEQVAAVPDKLALTDGEYSLTYSELNQRINQLARCIKRKVASPARIGIYLGRHVNVIIGIFAVLKSGNTYVPISSAAPAVVIQDIIMDCQPVMLLTQELLATHLAEQVADLNLDMLRLDTDWPSIAMESISNLAPSTFEMQPICILYTSGSTGKPKGVQIKQQSLINVLLSVQSEIDFTAQDKVLGITPITFDISGFDMYLPLISGASLIWMNDKDRLDPQQIMAYISKYQISIMQATPVTWQMLLDFGWNNVSGIKILSTGEGLDIQLAERLRKIGLLWNLYGPTETTIWSTLYSVKHTLPYQRYVLIGKPIANTKVYILDKYLQPVPVGMPGVLYIAGEGVSLGYLNNPELTKQKFIPNPFESNPKYAVMYNTGDLVRWLDDGQLEYFRRLDNQVKIRGLRIELGEIEACLLSHPSISQAVVVVKDSRLAAYLVLHKKPVCDKEELINYLKNRLYSHLIPSYFMILDSLPLTPNGKINKKALPFPTAGDPEKKLKAPETQTQHLLVDIWSQVLDIAPKNIGINEHLVDLGGHSLSAMQIASRIRSVFLVDITIADVFNYPSIEALATRLQASSKTQIKFEVQTIKNDAPYPLSNSQMRLWFLNEIYANSAVYNLTSAWKISSEVNVANLERAFFALIERHPVFRTRFNSDQGKPQQVLKDLDSIGFQLEIETLEAGLSQQEITAHLKLLAAEPFELHGDKLFRFRLLQQTDKDCILFICVHHMIIDGWSLGILYRELSLLYAFYSGNNQTIQLPKLPAQYLDYCIWQQSLFTPLYALQLEYWKQQLSNLSHLELPIDHHRPAIQTFSGQTTSIAIPRSIVAALRRLSQDHQLTLFTSLLSAFALLLAKYTQQTDFAIGIPVANRNILSLENLIGFFVNTLAIRFNYLADQSVLELLKVAQSTLMDAQAHADVPFEKVVDVLQPERDQSRNPIFQVMFGFNNVNLPDINLSGSNVKRLDVSGSFSRFELAFFLEEKHEMIEGTVEYNTDLFDLDTIENFIKHYLALLAEIARNPMQKIQDLSFLSPLEKQVLLVEWNNTARDFSLQQKNLAEFFEQQVIQNPQKLAVQSEDHTLSYRDLNRQANQLAHFIRTRLPGDGHHILLYLDRSIPMVVCLLAILKSNNVYIPIAKETPLSLMRQITHDCKAAMILTSSVLVPNLTEIAMQTDMHIVELERIADSLAVCCNENLNLLTSDKNLAYVLYTSGTTGQPKGVAIRQHSLINLLLAIQKEVDFTPHEILLAVTPVTFDIAMLEIFLPLISGASLILASHAERLDPHQMMKSMTKHQVTMMQATPATWQILINANWKNEQDIKMLCGGEALNTQLASQLLATGTMLWNVYGPTETTIWSTIHRVTQINPDTAIISIGKPLANTQTYVLDGHRQLVPIGIPGELYIGGAGIAEGYLNNPTLTQKYFIPNPFSLPDLHSKLYRTGDLVMWSKEGVLNFLGRIDTQIKIRGHRIEVEAIENLLRDLPAIKDCAVLDKNSKGEKELSVYMIIKKEPVSLQMIQAELKLHLPDYMVPSKFIVIEALPLTPNGKVDRKKLSTMTNVRALTDEFDHSVVENEQEKIIVSEIKSLLNITELNPQSNFFDVGVHSLLLLQLSCSLSKALNKQINIIDFFIYPSARALAQFLRVQDSDHDYKEQNEEINQRATARRQRKTFKR